MLEIIAPHNSKQLVSLKNNYIKYILIFYIHSYLVDHLINKYGD